MTSVSGLLVTRGEDEDVVADAPAAVGHLLDEDHAACGGGTVAASVRRQKIAPSLTRAQPDARPA